ncbi:hypothetical protein [Streptomyces spinosirectus]
MPADEVIHGADVDELRVRSGPRHAAPRKPLFTRFHMPAGKAIAIAAMPTAVLVGMGFTSSLALADSGGSTSPTAKSLTADEYKDCVAALGDGASASPSPSASESTKDATATPSPSSTADASKDSSKSPSGSSGKSSSDSGSAGTATPTSSATDGSKDTSGGDTASPSPSASASSGGGLLSGVGDALGSLLGGGSSSSGSSATPSATASPSASASASKDSSSSTSDSGLAGTVKDTTKKVTDTVDSTVKDTTDKVSKAADDATKAAQKAADSATSTASPSASSSADAGNCPTATDDQSGVDNKVPVADDPWYLNASSLLLKGADYKGVVEVKTANGTTKKVLKYVISGGTDIGDLHQTVKDKQQGKTYHVQAGSGTTSTIRDGDTTMYTESISGNLFGLIPITFSPDSPPPLNIPLIYFTNVKVVQAAQFGGTLHVPGMHVYTTDGTG